MIIDKLKQIFKIPDLKKSILFVLAMLVIFRFAAHVPMPGVDAGALKEFFSANQFLGLLNMFSGGGMENFSVVLLGIGPYITAAIIVELLTVVIPKLEELSKEGESGYQKINQYTRLLTVPLAALQAVAMITLLKQSSRQIIGQMGLLQFLTTIVTVTAGTVFLMWIGELISEKQIGNGISLLIFAGIVSHLPQAVKQTIAIFDKTQIINLAILAAIAAGMIIAIIAVTEGYRKIPISYARQIRGNKTYGGMESSLPIKVLQAGMIPIIFAISVVLFPPMIAQFFLRAKSAFFVNSAQFVTSLFQNQAFYAAIFFLLVVGFTYFYTAIVFHPDQMAENLQRQGAFIPGIRPGKPTALYIDFVSNRIMLGGSLFLGLVAILPIGIQQFIHVSTLMVSGASLLIIVGVVIEIMEAINAQLVMREYEEF
ncbi:preprotein translocase subunit SecY [Candidatus Falkowbacteria bacterium RBG_13_39_14]|uniref:Protein translocase subunit SecY n=1 Tax=Candidatus Falkowbacteria bacterium RBG_13_39_14 TaxID=1797985 RepID=A0A1F5S3N1_9BACT|nr:MAG: preprotein translocase subunit SecY [Candidatus Falkowbacteria bacterium RBG_13_39_14]